MPKLQMYNTGTSNALAVLKDKNDEDAWEIPPTDVHRFNFDSRNSMVPSVLAIRRRDRNEFQADQSGGPQFYSLDSSSETTHISFAANTSGFVGFGELLGNTLGLDFPPIVIAKRYNNDGVWLRNNVQYLAIRGDGSRSIASEAFVWPSAPNGVNIMRNSAYATRQILDIVGTSIRGNRAIDGYDGWVLGGIEHFSRDDIGTRDRTSHHQVIINLPADDRPIPFSSGAGGEGRRVVKITPESIQIARDGFDIETAVGDEILIDSSKSPIKIVASGIVNVAGNSMVEIDLPSGIDYGDNLFVEAIVNVAGEPVRHPVFRGSRSRNNIGVETRVLNNKLMMRTINGTAVQARYICYGSDERPPTSGSGGTLQTRTIDGEQVYQILAPGSSGNTLNLSDVLLDTRFPYVPIVKDGFIPIIPSQTTYRVDFDNPGFIPYVWFMSQLAVVSNGVNRGPFYIGGSAIIENNGALDPASCVAEIHDDHITFTTNPTGGAQADPRISGIRYYILALPN